jgi:hypothetical protein
MWCEIDCNYIASSFINNIASMPQRRMPGATTLPPLRSPSVKLSSDSLIFVIGSMQLLPAKPDKTLDEVELSASFVMLGSLYTLGGHE